MQTEDLIREAIKRLRRERRLTQRELADILGVQSNTVHLWEAGKRTPELKHLDAMCQRFGLEPSYFFGGGTDAKEDVRRPSSVEVKVAKIHRSVDEWWLSGETNEYDLDEILQFIDFLKARRRPDQ